jgi:hypothetical protein
MASKARLGEVLKMWGAVLGRRVDEVSRDTRETVEAQLRQRAQALGCVTSFLQLMPKQALTLLVKQVIAFRPDPNPNPNPSPNPSPNPNPNPNSNRNPNPNPNPNHNPNYYP